MHLPMMIRMHRRPRGLYGNGEKEEEEGEELRENDREGIEGKG